MALIDKEVVDAHLLEVRHVVRPRLDGVFHLSNLACRLNLRFSKPRSMARDTSLP